LIINKRWGGCSKNAHLSLPPKKERKKEKKINKERKR
jgi:hypothetical protein